MATSVVVGIVFVHLALLFYTIFIIIEFKIPRAAKSILFFLTTAVIFDITATTGMMLGTTGTYFTFHGILGYIGLLLMLTDAILVWKHKIKNGAEKVFSKGLSLYSKLAYTWWVIAFVTGVIISMKR